MNIPEMSSEELEDYLIFLSREIQRVVHDYERLPELQTKMRAVANELSRRNVI